MSRGENNQVEYPHLFRLLHWVLTVSFVILLLTGLSLHAAARPDWSIFSGRVPAWLWRGRVYVWHYWAAIFFFPSVLGTLAYCGRDPFWKRPTHIILTIGGLVTIGTGLWMLFCFGSLGAMKAAIALHSACGLAVLGPAFLWHAIRGVTKYLKYLVPSFRPLKEARWSHAAAFVPVALLTTWTLFEAWPIHLPWRTLVARRIAAQPSETIDMTVLPWSDAAVLNVRLVNGSGFQSGQTNLTLQALHDGNTLFVKAQWQDPTESRQYCPWHKLDDRWEHLQTNPKDETVHYEDKFSLVFPIEPDWHFEQVGCAVQCHVDGAYGWGYKGGAPDIDVWHWKSVRTDPVGQVDDKYWSELDFENEDVGRHGDPKKAGGYAKNYAEDQEHPLFLPDESSSIIQGAIPESHAVPYNAELGEKIPPGSIVSGIVCAAFQGDRGDVTCLSRHRNGRWILYMQRKLQTGSPYDLQFTPGGTYAFGCAAFDHAAKRHAYSIPVFHLTLAE